MPSPHNPTPRFILAAWGFLAVFALWLPHTATASPTPPAGGWGAAEMQAAAVYWGTPTPPLCGSTSVQFDAILPPDIVGRATVPSVPGTACEMQIASASVAGGLYYQCLIVVHEFGHWLGLAHSGDASSPMAAQLNPTIHVGGCERLASVTKRTHKQRGKR